MTTSLCYDIMELVKQEYLYIKQKEQNIILFNKVLKCIYIQEDDMDYINEIDNYQESCISWMLEIRKHNVENNY